ncbi:hypothetical protein EBU71_17465, partial [bacterium]|nr:hypothetical protein [Candidatus Elulimicrobium humile]
SALAAASIYTTGQAFFAGGINKNGPSSVIDIFNIASASWTTAQLSVARYNLCAVSISSLNVIFFAGGNDYLKVYKTIDIYITQASTWIVYNLTFARTEFSASALPEIGLVFFAGGRGDQNQDLNTVEIFDVVNVQFSIYTLNSARRSLISLSVPKSNLVYFVGGLQYYDAFFPRYMSDVDYFFFSNGTISQDVFFLPVGKAFVAGASLPIQSLVFIAGGETGLNSFFLNQVNIYGGCSSGYIQTINPSSCQLCQAGSFCHYGETIPQPCPTGYYCPSGLTNIFPCPAGTYGSSTGYKNINECIKCPSGKYNTLSAQTSPNSCLPCYPGSYCNSGSAFPRDCANNYYCPDPTSMIACPPGTFRISENSQFVSDCQPCPPGSFCPGNGNYATPCNPGFYASKNGSSACEICPSGSFCQFGATTPQICAVNTIAQKGSSACTPCEIGQYTNGPGYSSCLVCLNSYWTTDNWWCQDKYQRLISVTIWLGSIISVIITFVKVRMFFKKRIMKLRLADIPITFKNIILYHRHINNRNTYLKSLITRVEEAHNDQQYRNYEDEIRG